MRLEVPTWLHLPTQHDTFNRGHTCANTRTNEKKGKNQDLPCYIRNWLRRKAFQDSGCDYKGQPKSWQGHHRKMSSKASLLWPIVNSHKGQTLTEGLLIMYRHETMCAPLPIVETEMQTLRMRSSAIEPTEYVCPRDPFLASAGERQGKVHVQAMWRSILTRWLACHFVQTLSHFSCNFSDLVLSFCIVLVYLSAMLKKRYVKSCCTDLERQAELHKADGRTTFQMPIHLLVASLHSVVRSRHVLATRTTVAADPVSACFLYEYGRVGNRFFTHYI